MKRYLVLSINDNYIDVTSLAKIRNKYYIENNKSYDIGLELLLSNEKIYTKEILNKIRNDFNLNKKHNSIYFNLQNDQVIIRNIKDVSTKKESHIINLIKFEINAYIPLDLDNYSIKYKRVVNEIGQNLIQGILVPKKMINLCINLSQELNIKNRHLNVDFDILGKIMKSNLIVDFHANQSCYIVENRQNDVIINSCYNNQVIQSYIRNKDDRTKQYLNNICSSKNIYYYGFKDNFLDEINNIEKLKIKNEINTFNEDKDDEISTKYVCALGMIV